MKTERLERLIVVLKEVAKTQKAFNMCAWAMNEATEASGADYVEKHWNTAGKAEVTCGTSACAMGYAALDPVLQEKGLKLVISGFDESRSHNVEIPATTIPEFNQISRRATLEVNDVNVEFEGHSGTDAAMFFFGISSRAASWLFMPGYYQNGQTVTPKMVINRIKQVIECKGKAPYEIGAEG